jgi:predicted DNA binding CopG/RHH family protein
MEENKYNLSSEELEILKAVEDEIENDIKTGTKYPELESQKEVLSKVADNTLKRISRKKQYSFRLTETDVEKIKTLATHKGIPYQTYISSILHQVATRQIELSI